ncbi:ku80-like protein [Phanerochaete sordida]|uniref:ATP-dependent DNA helicase II subunit 2 n=1 Tax=Phanerochaete sordida TaxID=48140 RepID=A0A9P3GFY4_9APHY|nr:ku80-like protein [Phanerochaete sordida]
MTERAGYTVTMFLVDVSPSMGKMREVEIPLPNGEVQIAEMTNLEWALQFVKLKVQEMIYHERKTDQCGILLFGSSNTDNHVSRTQGGYDHIEELMPIAHPTANVITQISAVTPSTEIGDPLDALVVGIETQDNYLGKKKWTRRMVLLTDAENPIEIQHLDRISQRLNELKIRLTVIGIDFDDEEVDYVEEDKSDIKRENEEFYHSFVDTLDNGVVGNCAVAIEEISRPEAKQTKSQPSASVLRLGDAENHPEEAFEINVKICKCTALVRPKSFKKFAKISEDVEMRDPDDDEEPTVEYGQLNREIRYSYDPTERPDDEDAEEDDDDKKKGEPQDVEKEELVRGYKYGTSFVPVPENNFPKLETKRGMEICGFFKEQYFRREWCIDEVRYVFAAEKSPLQQVALSSLVDAMYQKTETQKEITYYAVTRWVTTEGSEPKMGVLKPMKDDMDNSYFLWVQMPFADDLRKWTFPSLDHLISSKGETVTKHPYIPTERQLEAMEELVDALDLMEAGEKDEDGNRTPWYDTRLSYNPAVHRIKQAQFHAAIVEDLNKQPLPPPHPELLKYFEPPRRVLKHARLAIDAAREAFGVKEVPKTVGRGRKDGHVRARDDGDEMLLLDKQPAKRIKLSQTQSQHVFRSQHRRVSPPTQRKAPKRALSDDSDTEPEPEPEPQDDDDLLLDTTPAVKPEPRAKPEPAEAGVPPTPSSRSPTPERDRAPGRIIGTTHPLAEFYANTASGDLVSKAVEDLAFVVRTVVFKPFTTRRTDEMLECVRALRRVCLEEDEVDAWNQFLRDLKRRCLDDDPGNEYFWSKLSDLGRDVSLISASEAQRQGGRSDVSDAEADKFLTTGMAE